VIVGWTGRALETSTAGVKSTVTVLTTAIAEVARTAGVSVTEVAPGVAATATAEEASCAGVRLVMTAGATATLHMWLAGRKSR
jgi:short-subunit dehydrogenase